MGGGGVCIVQPNAIALSAIAARMDLVAFIFHSPLWRKIDTDYSPLTAALEDSPPPCRKIGAFALGRTRFGVLNDFQNLLESAPRFLCGASPTLSSRQLAVTKRNSPMAFANDLERRRIGRSSKIEPRLRRNVGMAPAVDDDARDVMPCVEPGIAEHLLQLFANLQFEIRVACREQPGAGIEVAVKSGAVTLSGKVHTEHAKEKAEKLTKKTKGVTSVVNNLVATESEK